MYIGLRGFSKSKLSILDIYSCHPAMGEFRVLFSEREYTVSGEILTNRTRKNISSIL